METGTVKLVGTNASEIITNVNLFLSDKPMYNKMAQAHNPYGDGKACERIISNYF
jgi:UDP-N-acetylglucosamine 2-epimerase (non-hydrolysing)